MRGSLLVKTFAAAAVTSVLFAPLAHADDAAFMGTLERDSLSCGQGLISCSSTADLPAIGKSLCFDIDKNGDSVSGAIHKMTGIYPADPAAPTAMVTGNHLLEFAVVALATYCPRNGIGS